MVERVREKMEEYVFVLFEVSGYLFRFCSEFLAQGIYFPTC